MNSFVSDVRQTIRSLRASPGLVAVSVLSLGLGLGVNLSLFTAIDAVFFYEPTLADPGRVVAVHPGNNNQFSYLNYRDLVDSDVFESVTGYRRAQLNLRADAVPERIDGLAVAPGFFEFIGAPPALGRLFDAAEAVPDRQPRVAVLSDVFWQRRFGSDTAVIGRPLTINGEPFTIVGVLSGVRPVTMLEDPDVYVPISRITLPTVDDRRNGNALTVLARLPPGMTRAQALGALDTVNGRLEQAYPVENRDMGRPGTIRSVRGGDFAGAPEQVIVPSVLLALFGLVLLSACANVAGLLLAKAAGRQREIAVRVSLGARRAEIVRLLLIESFSLAILGLLAGGILFVWLNAAVSAVSLPGAGTLNLSLEPSLALGGYALVLLLVTGLVCGIAPALRTARRDVTTVMHAGEGHNVTGRLWLRHTFVVGQVAVCLVLLIVSSLLLRSLMRVMVMDPGFDMEHGVVANVFVDADRYLADGGLPLGERLADDLGRLPGVESVSFANILPLGGDRSATRLQLDGTDSAAGGARTFVNSISPRYFATLGIPFVRGRDFDTGDRAGAPPVAIVTEAFERAYFAGASAIGKRVRQSDDQPFIEIVGVVRDHMYGSYGDTATPIFYSAYAQQPRISTQIRPVVLHIRTGNPTAIVRNVRAAIAAVDPTVSADVRMLREATGSEPAIRRFGTQLLAAASGLGLLLAAIGLYGMMAFVVATRTSEIGIRMALGATSIRILGRVMGQGLLLVGIGLAAGTVVSLLLARAAIGLLAGLSPADPVAFAGSAALLVCVGLAACFSPAWRAARIDPLVALRRL